MQKKKIFFFAYLILMIIGKEVIDFPKLITIFLHLKICAIVLSFIVASYNYYESLVSSQKTVLTYLMQTLNVLTGTGVIWYCLSDIILIFPTNIQSWFESYPNLACSCLRAENITPVIVCCMTLIVAFKTFLTLNSTGYLNMNHEKIFKYILLIFSIFTLAEHFSVIFVYGTLCVKGKVNQLIFAKGIQILEENFKTSPMLFVIHVAVLFTLTLTYNMLKYFKSKKKSNNSCYKYIPTVSAITANEEGTIDFPIAPTISSNKESKIIFVREYKSEDIINGQFQHETAVSNNSVIDEIQTNTQKLILSPRNLNINDIQQGIPKENNNNSNIGIAVCLVCIVATFFTFITAQQNKDLLGITQVLAVSLSLHLSPVAWVLTSSEKTKFMLRKVNCVNQLIKSYTGTSPCLCKKGDY